MLEKSASRLDQKGELYPDTPASSTIDLFEDGSVDPVYQAKAHVLNAAIQEIGMGKYQVRVPSNECRRSKFQQSLGSQWWLFAIAGFGWFAYVHLSVLEC